MDLIVGEVIPCARDDRVAALPIVTCLANVHEKLARAGYARNDYINCELPTRGVCGHGESVYRHGRHPQKRTNRFSRSKLHHTTAASLGTNFHELRLESLTLAPGVVERLCHVVTSSYLRRLPNVFSGASRVRRATLYLRTHIR